MIENTKVICPMMWLNRNVATINTTLQLLDIYRLDCSITKSHGSTTALQKEHREMDLTQEFPLL